MLPAVQRADCSTQPPFKGWPHAESPPQTHPETALNPVSEPSHCKVQHLKRGEVGLDSAGTFKDAPPTRASPVNHVHLKEGPGTSRVSSG